MAEVYSYCNGTVKQNTTINMSQGSLKTRTYSIGDGQNEIEEDYRVLTFTASVAPAVDLQIRYIYAFKYRTSTSYQTGDYTPFRLKRGYIIIPAGRTSVTKEVPIQIERCYYSQSGVRQR